MKAKEYRSMNDSKLEKELLRLRVELTKAHGKMEQAKVSNRQGKKVKGVNLQSRIRKEIAKILTIQGERKK